MNVDPQMSKSFIKYMDRMVITERTLFWGLTRSLFLRVLYFINNVSFSLN